MSATLSISSSRKGNRHRMAPKSNSARAAPRSPDRTDTRSLKSWIFAHETFAFFLFSSLCVFALYDRALTAPFIYDDLDQVVNNPALASGHAFVHRFLLAPVAFTSGFRGPGGLSYRPVYWISLALDRHLWGLSASGFHLTNLLLHLLNGLLGFRLLRRLKLPLLLSSATALIWLGLPIHAEVVAWISGRAYSLSTAFLLLALLTADWHLRTRKPLVLGIYLSLALAAVLSHEQGLLLLPLTWLLLYASGRSQRRPWLIFSILALTADTLCLLLRHLVIPHPASGPASPLAFGLFFWKYIGWILVPVHMSVERSTSTPANLPTLAALTALLATVALLATAYLLRNKQPAQAAGLLWLVLCLAPFCGVVFIYQGMAERFTYLASAGVTLSMAALVLLQRPRLRALPAWLIAAPLLLWITWNTHRLITRVNDWTDPVALYRNSLDATPGSPSLLYNTGYALREAGQLAEAETFYRRAILLQPIYPRAFSSLGELYASRGDLPAAEAADRHALALDPTDAGTTLNLAVILQQRGSVAEAQDAYERAIALAPSGSAAYTDLGTLLFAQGRTSEAAAMFRKAIESRATDAAPYFNLATLYQQTGRSDLALPLYRKVLELKPNDPDTLANLRQLQQPR